MTNTMKAIKLFEPGDIDKLVLTEVPIPQPAPGWIRIRVKAFGVNESEVTSRRGQSSPDFSMPRILGIECVGIVDEVTDGVSLIRGQSVATMMGGMGRSFDGSYAEYVVVPANQVIPFDTNLPWEVVGAVPEMFQTAYGSLTKGLNIQSGQTLLIRGGTSTVGLSAATMAKDIGATVVSTTRRADRLELLRQFGVDHPIVDTDQIATQVRAFFPSGVDAALELVGGSTLQDTLRATRLAGTVCFTGALSDNWTIPEFNPLSFIPFGTRLTSYGGRASDLPPDALKSHLQAISQGRLKICVAKIYSGLEGAREAHKNLESGSAPGKHVVLLR